MEQQRRQSLSAPRGPIRTKGDRAKCDALKQTFEAAKNTDWREDVHGFHAYPGRMHPAVPRVLLPTIPGEGLRVLDPFCGSGTTLVETMAAGHQGIGMDIHPLAVRIARINAVIGLKKSWSASSPRSRRSERARWREPAARRRRPPTDDRIRKSAIGSSPTSATSSQI